MSAPGLAGRMRPSDTAPAPIGGSICGPLISQSNQWPTNSCGSITSFPCSRPPYRLLQLPANALVRDPILRDRGDSLTLPSGSIGWLALSDFAHLLFVIFLAAAGHRQSCPPHHRTIGPQPSGMLVVSMTTAQRIG